MKIIRILLPFFTFSCSCASLINPPFQKVNVDHDPGISVRVDTSKFLYRKSDIYNVYIPKDYNKQNMYVLRSNYEIPLIVNDAMQIWNHLTL